MSRSGLSKPEAEARIASQLPQKEKVARVTHPFCSLGNDSSVEGLHEAVDRLVGLFREGPRTWKGWILDKCFSRTSINILAFVSAWAILTFLKHFCS